MNVYSFEGVSMTINLGRIVIVLRVGMNETGDVAPSLLLYLYGCGVHAGTSLHTPVESLQTTTHLPQHPIHNTQQVPNRNF